jgi:hypothetical protein
MELARSIVRKAGVETSSTIGELKTNTNSQIRSRKPLLLDVVPHKL